MSSFVVDTPQISLLGNLDLLKRIDMFLKGRESTFAENDTSLCRDVESMEISIRDLQEGALICVVDADSFGRDIATQLLSTIQEDKLVEVIFLSDDVALQDFLRKQGALFFCGIEGPELSKISSVLDLAYHTLNLKNSQKYLETQNAEAEKRFQDVADQFVDWLWEMDLDLNLKFSSARRRPGQKAQSGEKFTAAFLPEEKMRIEDDFQDLIRYPRNFHDRDYWSSDTYGTRLCWSVSGVPVYNIHGELNGFRGIAKDISLQKASTDQLYFLSNHDPLTGLHNRSRFFDELGRSLRLSRRESRQSGLVLFNLDKFSLVNETYGHVVGDKFLVHVSQILKDSMRRHDFLARNAGDEFAVIFQDSDESQIIERIEMVLSRFKAHPLMTDKGGLSIRASVGYVVYPNSTDDADALLLQSIFALNKAKAKGRGRVEKYIEDEDTSAISKDKLEWADLITRRLQEEKDALILNFQPIIKLSDADNVSEKPMFYEVLVRMADEDGVACPPHKFIKTAEDFGLVRLLDKQVSVRAIQKLKEFHDKGEKVRLSVNLSGYTFDDDDVKREIKETLIEANLPDKSFIIEIAETALIRDLAQVKAFMEELKSVGAGFALDDCGGGFSSFNTIRHLDVDFLKIDGGFVRNMHTSKESKAFVEAIQHIAQQKGVGTIAEMVENENIVNDLKKLGVEYGQGFYFGAPRPQLGS